MSILINGNKYKILGFQKLSIENNIYYSNKPALSGIFAVSEDEKTVSFWDTNPFPGALSISWGDGTSTDLTTVSEVSHTYETGGNYNFEVKGKDVLSLTSSAFYNCGVLKKLEIGNTITLIEPDACYNCSYLSEVIIGPNVTKIGNSAFSGCGLLTITIPDKVTAIGEQAFSYCTLLSDVIVGNGVETIGHQCFYHCETLGYISLGDNIKAIGKACFRYCYSLSDITFPSSLQTIYPRFVGDCSYLNSINFQDTDRWYLDEGEAKTYTTLADVSNPTENANKLKSESGEWYYGYLHKKPE